MNKNVFSFLKGYSKFMRKYDKLKEFEKKEVMDFLIKAEKDKKTIENFNAKNKINCIEELIDESCFSCCVSDIPNCCFCLYERKDLSYRIKEIIER